MKAFIMLMLLCGAWNQCCVSTEMPQCLSEDAGRGYLVQDPNMLPVLLKGHGQVVGPTNSTLNSTSTPSKHNMTISHITYAPYE